MFLGGAGLQPWIWDDLRAMLAVEQTSAVASRPCGAGSGLADYARQAFADAPAATFTIVAHSVGTVVALKMHELAPKRINGLLGVAGVVPTAGGSFISSMPFPNRLLLRVAMRIGGTRPPDKVVRNSLCAGLDDNTTGRVINDFTPEPVAVFRDRIAGGPGPAHVGYVATAADSELPEKLQNRFAARLGADWTRTLTTGHLPMLENPRDPHDALATFLGDRR